MVANAWLQIHASVCLVLMGSNAKMTSMSAWDNTSVPTIIQSVSTHMVDTSAIVKKDTNGRNLLENALVRK